MEGQKEKKQLYSGFFFGFERDRFSQLKYSGAVFA